MTESMVQGVPVTTYTEGAVPKSLQAIWEKIMDQVADASIFLPLKD
jgi:hypothetical protein